MPKAAIFAGWAILLLSLFGGVWILFICLQHRKRRELKNNENGAVKNGNIVERKKKRRGRSGDDDNSLPNGRPRSHDQRELPNIPNGTVDSAATTSVAIAMVMPSHSVVFDEEDGGHYDVIPRLPPGTLSRDDTELDSTYAPVGSETYSTAANRLPDAVLLLENEELDPNYANVGGGGLLRRSIIGHPRHNYETVEATYAQVGQRPVTDTGLLVHPTITSVPLFDSATGMSASSKEARYFKVTAREPLADLRRRQAEEEAEAERLREAAYATVGDYDSEVMMQGTPPPPIPPADHELRSTHVSQYAEVGDIRAEVVPLIMSMSMSSVPEPPPVHTLKRLTSCNASPRHDTIEAGYSSVGAHRPSKINSLPRSIQGINFSTSSSSDVYSVVNKRRQDKVATIHVVPGNDFIAMGNGNGGHVDDIYAVVNKPRRHNSARAGSDGAAAAMAASNETKRLLLDKMFAKSSATPPLNGYHQSTFDEVPGYSRCKDVTDRPSAAKQRDFVDGFVVGTRASLIRDAGDPNYESIDAVVESANAKLRSDAEAPASSDASQHASSLQLENGGRGLISQLTRPKTWVPQSGSVAASIRINGLVHHGISSAAAPVLMAPTAVSNNVGNSSSATVSSWQKRQPTEPIYQDIDEIQHQCSNTSDLGDTFARL